MTSEHRKKETPIGFWVIMYFLITFLMPSVVTLNYPHWRHITDWLWLIIYALNICNWCLLHVGVHLHPKHSVNAAFRALSVRENTEIIRPPPTRQPYYTHHGLSRTHHCDYCVRQTIVLRKHVTNCHCFKAHMCAQIFLGSSMLSHPELPPVISSIRGRLNRMLCIHQDSADFRLRMHRYTRWSGCLLLMLLEGNSL